MRTIFKGYAPKCLIAIKVLKPWIGGKKMISFYTGDNYWTTLTKKQIRDILNGYRRWLAAEPKEKVEEMGRTNGWTVRFYKSQNFAVIEVGCKTFSLVDIEFIENLLWK